VQRTRLEKATLVPRATQNRIEAPRRSRFIPSATEYLSTMVRLANGGIAN